MSRSLKWLIFVYAVVFMATGVFMVFIVNADETSPYWVKLLSRNHGIVFVWHLACWMLTGMFANYYWDLFNLGKGASAMQIERILLPLLVSPIVFYPTYNLWLSSSSQSYLLFDVIGFQSGFFWQALFTKAKPIDSYNPAQWTARNSGATQMTGGGTPGAGPGTGR